MLGQMQNKTQEVVLNSTKMNVLFLFKNIILVQYTFFYSKTAQKGVPIWEPLL